MPETGATALMPWLMAKYPGEYTVKQTRTLQRRIALWRLEQESQEKKMRELMITEPALTIEITAAKPPKMTDKNCVESSQSLA